MLSRIVIPIDGSTTAERIFDYVAPIARRTHSQVVLVTVFGMGHTVLMPGLIDDTIEHLEREANAGLDAKADCAAPQPVRLFLRGRRATLGRDDEFLARRARSRHHGPFAGPGGRGFRRISFFDADHATQCTAL